MSSTSAQSTPSTSSTAAAVTAANVSLIGVSRAALRVNSAMAERMAASDGVLTYQPNLCALTRYTPWGPAVTAWTQRRCPLQHPVPLGPWLDERRVRRLGRLGGARGPRLD